MIAEIIINTTAKQLQQTFSYMVPPELNVHIGSRVLVPFGSRREEGIVVAITHKKAEDFPFPLKYIQQVLSSQTGFQEEMIRTSWWISQYYLCSMADALRLFMIEKKALLYKTYIIANGSLPEQNEITAYVHKKGRVEKRALLSKFDAGCIENYLKTGQLSEVQDWQNKIADKTEKWLCFRKDDTEGILRNRPRQAALLAEVKKKGDSSVTALMQKGYSRDVIQRLCGTGLAFLAVRPSRTTSLMPSVSDNTYVQLTEEQLQVIKQIQQDQKGNTYVLHGVTGSGKTEVYMQLTEYVLHQGKQVLVLVPEIALTGQIVRRFVARFGDDVVVMHSKLSKGERKNNWIRMFRGESHICIGARSAVFTAAQQIGLIIVDESHDSSYKQEESPRYHAIAVARRRAAYYGCPVVLGSATPSINDYYLAQKGIYTLLELPRRVMRRLLPTVQVVDMRDELACGNYGVLSDAMTALIARTLEEKQQVIILLNRRGFSTFVMCRKCGYVVKCNTCDVPMVYHKENAHLRCHYCDAEKIAPTVCPACGSKYIKFFGTGTEKVEEELGKLFPQCRVVRLDQDTVRRKNSSDRILSDFRNHKYDILLGTQMVAKGHDFEHVSAVGILSADSLLNLPAYWAGERTFQLLTQAAGRAGRGTIPGQVVMQTYAPDHYVIKCAQKQDYTAFYRQEIELRRAFLYPPFHDLVKIIVAGEEEQAAWQLASDIAETLRKYSAVSDKNTEIIGPFSDIIKKVRGKYRVIILLKGPDLENMKSFMRKTSLFWRQGVIIDVDPIF